MNFFQTVNLYEKMSCIICRNKIFDGARYFKCLYAKPPDYMEAYLHVYCYANVINTPKLLEKLNQLLDKQLAES